MQIQAWSDERANEILNDVVRLAQSDGDFRAKCLADPNGAVFEVSGMELPRGFRIRFVDNAQADLTVVLPDRMEDGGIPDSKLEEVSGASGCVVGTCGGSGACILLSVYCVFTCGGTGPSI